MRPPTRIGNKKSRKMSKARERHERRGKKVKYLRRLTCRVFSSFSFDEWRSCLGPSILGTTVDAAAFPSLPFRSTFAALHDSGYATETRGKKERKNGNEMVVVVRGREE